MKNKITLILSLITVLFSCDDTKDDIETSANIAEHVLFINDESHDVKSATGYLKRQSWFTSEVNIEDSIRLLTSIGLVDDTLVAINFNNDDLNAENIVLGDYTTSTDIALSANEFKYAEVVVVNSNGYFSSLGVATDAVKLIKCDKTENTISGEYEATLTNKENNETMHVKGTFTNVSLVVTL